MGRIHQRFLTLGCMQFQEVHSRDGLEDTMYRPRSRSRPVVFEVKVKAGDHKNTRSRQK